MEMKKITVTFTVLVFGIAIAVFLSIVYINKGSGTNLESDKHLDAETAKVFPSTIQEPKTTILDMPKTGQTDLDRKVDAARKLMLQENVKVNISGMVEDQDGLPVSGATVTIAMFYYSGLVKADYSADIKTVRLQPALTALLLVHARDKRCLACKPSRLAHRK